MYAIIGLVVGYYTKALLSTCAQLVNKSDGLVYLVELNKSLGTLEKNIGIAEYDAVLRSSPPSALD